MGNADIRGVWDNELPGIRLDAQIAEKGISSTHVTGYVSPKLKALDLMIEADSTNIGLLTPYVEGIFSELNGRVTGDVRLFGGFKTLDFEGKVSALLDTKVDVLNTYLQVRNDSVHIRPGEFALDNVRIAGVMGMATNTEDEAQIAHEFGVLAGFFHEMKEVHFKDAPEFKEISMGMSDDYPIAISHGSTLIRIGSKIFGRRVILNALKELEKM